MLEFIGKILHYHPEIWAAILGVLAGAGMAQVIGTLWLRPLQFWHKMKLMAYMDFCGSASTTFIAWHYFDPDLDPNGLRMLGSIIVGILAILIHLVILMYFRHKWPWLFADIETKKPHKSKRKRAKTRGA